MRTRVTVQNLVKISQWLRRYRDLNNDFRNGGRRHLGFFKIQIINGWYILTADTLEGPNLRHPAKFHQDRSIRFWDMAIFLFFKMVAVRHVEFWKVRFLRFGRPTVRSAHAHYLVKCGRNRSNSCWDMAIFRFSRWRPSAVLNLNSAIFEWYSPEC